MAFLICSPYIVEQLRSAKVFSLFGNILHQHLHLPAADHTFLFRDIVATDAEIALGYFIGLPESPIGEIEIRDSVFTVKEDAKPGKPAMLCGVEDMVKQGFLFENVGIVRFENVSIEGQSGKPIQTINVDEVIA